MSLILNLLSLSFLLFLDIVHLFLVFTLYSVYTYSLQVNPNFLFVYNHISP